MTSHSGLSTPVISRGRSASVAGSCSASLKQGIWMISFIGVTRGYPRTAVAAAGPQARVHEP